MYAFNFEQETNAEYLLLVMKERVSLPSFFILLCACIARTTYYKNKKNKNNNDNKTTKMPSTYY